MFFLFLNLLCVANDFLLCLVTFILFYSPFVHIVANKGTTDNFIHQSQIHNDRKVKKYYKIESYHLVSLPRQRSIWRSVLSIVLNLPSMSVGHSSRNLLFYCMRLVNAKTT